MKESYIAAIEIGSSKITGAVGYFTADGILQVLALEQEQSRDSVRYGIIQNPEEAATRVMRIIDRLNSHPAISPRKITGVYVGLSGRSMRSIPSDVNITFPEEVEITGEMLQRLREDAATIPLPPNHEILSIVARSYHIDGLETSSPKGAMGKSISAVFDIIIGRTELKRNILRALSERLDIEIRGMMITQLAASEIVLSDEEKRLGCMLVDFGAETTAVSIYRKGALCYFATLPLGGRNITRDLTTLSILEEKAEEIKRESGRAVAPETPSTLNVSGIKLSDVSNLVVARAEEIVANVVQQIAYAGLKEKDLPGGIVCIGDGAHLTGILELLSNISGLNARLFVQPSFIQPMEPRFKRHDAIECAALLYAGALTEEEDCLQLTTVEEDYDYDNSYISEQQQNVYEEEEYEERKPGRVGRFFSKLSSGFSNMFANTSDEDSELD